MIKSNIKTMVLSNTDADRFVQSINEFVKDKEVIDIKYQSFPVSIEFDPKNGIPIRGEIVDRVLIIYKDRS